MSITIEVKETSAWASRAKLEAEEISAQQILASMGYITINGVPHKVTKLLDIDTGLEIT